MNPFVFRIRQIRKALIWTAAFVGLASAAHAQSTAVAYEQKLGSSLALNEQLRDELGQETAVLKYFRESPVVLIFGYWNCPQLCSVVSSAAIDALRQIRPTPANHFTLLYVSIDPKEMPKDASEAKARDLRAFAHASSGEDWHYLTGDEGSIERFAASAGFHYRFDAASRQYAHPSGFIVATPTGAISRYFLGVDFRPAELDRALQEARSGEIGASTFQLLLQCFRGAGIGGKYGPLIWRMLQIAVAATVVSLGGGIGWMIYRERRGEYRKGAL